MKLVVISICLNEEKTIGKVLDKIPKKIKGISKIEKIVIDDGSTDKTVEIAKKHGAKVFQNYQQKRLAYSFQKAVRKALELGADIAVNIDGDLQFDPGEIPLLVEPIVKGEADFVAANRFVNIKTGKRKRPENMPKSKYKANQLGAKIVGALSKRRFDDVTCGFRAYNREALLNLNVNSKYTYTQESFQVLATKKMNIVQVPVSIKYYPGRKSRVVKNFFAFAFGSGVNILRAFRDHEPLRFFLLLGALPMISGFLLSLFVCLYWLDTGSFSPYKSVGFVGVYLMSVGAITWLVGLFADILDRVLRNQEKILYLEKKNLYPEDRKSPA